MLARQITAKKKRGVGGTAQGEGRQGCIKTGRGAYISQSGVHKVRQGFIYFSGRGAYISQAGVNKGRQGFIYRVIFLTVSKF